MPLGPTIIERLARARADLRMGVPVVLTAGGCGALAVAVETLSATRLAGLRDMGAPELVLTARRADTLKARAYDGDLARIAIPDGAALPWLRAIADPADDLNAPMKGPLRSLRDGPADLHRAAIQLVKSAHLLPAAVVVPVPHALALAGEANLTLIALAEAGPELLRASPLHAVASARLPMAASQAGRVHVFRPEDGGEEHFAIEIGRPERSAPVLARLHSACFTGDVLGSLKCDCGPQLHAAIAAIARNPQGGILLYLQQEGRGIGLLNKLRAYALQDQGWDTVDANTRLGFEPDERDFSLAAAMLRALGVGSVALMTNNPLKVDGLAAHGFRVSRVAHDMPPNPHNAAYLATKRDRQGHML